MLNILSNAIQYNSEHGCISLDSEIIDQQRLRISVSDCGEGLTEEEIANLFTPFERLNTINNVHGAGIGLVISKHLMEIMKGSIGVKSTPNRGSTFWLEVQLAPSQDKKSSQES